MGEEAISKIKKYLPIAVAAVVLIAVIIIILSIVSGPRKAVKSFISGMNKKNASKIVNSIDFIGSAAWSYKYDPDDFSKDDYKEFVEKYKDLKDDTDKDYLKDQKKSLKEMFDDEFDDLKDEYKSYKVKIDKFKSVEKLGKSLYAIEAKISIKAKPKDKDEDEIDETETATFIVYKNKIIYSDIF